MVGTLVGMVQMFANMDDPSKLGPFMATALLATLYGAVLANLVCMPIADKVHLKAEDLDINSTLIIDGVLAIRESKSPTLVRELLMAYLPEHHRHEEAVGLTMARKKKAAHGGHGWFVTFADLMGLLMSFFVMLTAYSTMDQKKLQMVAGSMAQAFGTLKESRFSGVIEIEGVPTRPNLQQCRECRRLAGDRPPGASACATSRSTARPNPTSSSI